MSLFSEQQHLMKKLNHCTESKISKTQSSKGAYARDILKRTYFSQIKEAPRVNLFFNLNGISGRGYF